MSFMLSRILNECKMFVVIFAAIFLLNACQNIEEYEEQPFTSTEETVSLTVLARDVYTRVLSQAASSMAREWSRDERGTFRLEHINYSPLDKEEQASNLQTQLMAGQGPDMLFWDGVPIWMHQASGFFADINDLIEQNPNTSRDDFYSHVLEAWEFDGGLYIFPLSFEIESVGISANLPQSIITRFYEHNSITYHELLRIYLDLIREYPEFSHMAIANDSLIDRLLFEFGFELADKIDFNARSSHVNEPQFTYFLEDIKLVKELAPLITNQNEFARENALTAYSEYFVFWLNRRMLYATLEPSEIHYLNFIPIVTRDGGIRLLHHYNYLNAWVVGSDFIDLEPAPDWGSISILNNENTHVAWEFTQHVISTMAFHNQIDNLVVAGQTVGPRARRAFGRYGFYNTAIRREYFRPRLEEMFNFMFLESPTAAERRSVFNISEYEAADVGNINRLNEAISRMEGFNEMPFTLLPFIPTDLYQNYLQDFLLGFITAQQAADGLHNRISLWLIE